MRRKSHRPVSELGDGLGYNSVAATSITFSAYNDATYPERSPYLLMGRQLSLLFALLAVALSDSCLAATDTNPGWVSVHLYANARATSVRQLEVAAGDSSRGNFVVRMIPIRAGVASATIKVPTGRDGALTFRGFDQNGQSTHFGRGTFTAAADRPVLLAISLTSATESPIRVLVGTAILVVFPLPPPITVLDSVQLFSVLLGPDSNTHPAVEWRSTNPLVANVDSGGLLVPKDTGDVLITATLDSLRTEILVHIAPPTLVGAGDIAVAGGFAEATAQLLDRIPGTVFTVGDNVYPIGLAEEWTALFAPTWGRHRGRMRPALGNHDYGNYERPVDASPYFDYFGSIAGDRSKGYYSYPIANWRVLVLNSEVPLNAGSPQELWLRGELAADTSLCTLAYLHRPLFGSGFEGNHPKMRDAWVALHQSGVEIVIAGHDHDYERFAPQTPDGVADTDRGIRQFVVGTGGAALLPWRTIHGNSEARTNQNHGVLRLSLLRSGYRWEFVTAAGPTFADTGSGLCHR